MKHTVIILLPISVALTREGELESDRRREGEPIGKYENRDTGHYRELLGKIITGAFNWSKAAGIVPTDASLSLIHGVTDGAHVEIGATTYEAPGMVQVLEIARRDIGVAETRAGGNFIGLSDVRNIETNIIALSQSVATLESDILEAQEAAADDE